MAVLPFKSRGSQLRRLLKVLKEGYDDPVLLAQSEPRLRRYLFFGTVEDEGWRSEGIHQQALLQQRLGDDDRAETYFEAAIHSFEPHELLGRSRVMRDYGLFKFVRRGNAEESLEYLAVALDLHARDIPNDKSRRQQRITENYRYYVLVQSGTHDEDARQQLVAFALRESRDCHIREQEQAIEFALDVAAGLEVPLLRLRQAEVAARRRRPKATAKAAAHFVVDSQLVALGVAVRSIIRKE